MSKILLLGGTGAIGVYLRDILAECGHEVYVTSRKVRDNNGTVKFVVGDAKDDAFLIDLFRKLRPDVVVDFMIYGTKAFECRVKMLLEGSGQYIFLSSYRVFADQMPLTEQSLRLLDCSNDIEFLDTDEYALAKARQENLLRNSGRKNWTIVRPGITYSRGRFQFGCLEADIVCARSFAGIPVVMPPEMMDKVTTLTWGGDVATMIAGLIDNPLSIGEDFNCASNEAHTWREIAEIYGRCIGMKVKPCTLEEYIDIIGSKYQPCYDRMYNRVFDNSKILSATGLRQSDFKSTEEGLKDELCVFKGHPHYDRIDIVKQAKIDRIVNTYFHFERLTFSERIRYIVFRAPWISRVLPIGITKKILRVVRACF